MAIRHHYKPAREAFTQVPNAWMRDRRISLKARGLLATLMTHRVGYRVTLRTLAASGPDGEAAIRSALDELREAGYLTMERRADETGRFQEVDWVIADPEEQPYPADPVEDPEDQPARGSSVRGKPTCGDQPPIEEHQPLEHQDEEHQGVSTRANALEPLLDVPPGASADSPHDFDRFWELWPGRRVGKPHARKAYAKAAKKVGGPRVLDGVGRLRADPNLPDQQFIPHPATWLNREGWDDEPYPPRAAPDTRVASRRETRSEQLARQRAESLAALGLTDTRREHAHGEDRGGRLALGPGR